MRVVDYTLKLLGISEAIRRWQGLLGDVDQRRRENVARFAEAIAGTLARAAEAFVALAEDAGDEAARRAAVRELGRIGGYVENIAAALEGHIDGRRLAGLRRRLDGLGEGALLQASIRKADRPRIERLLAAEGYFRALADGLRA